jgi:hypothetical protein
MRLITDSERAFLQIGVIRGYLVGFLMGVGVGIVLSWALRHWS